MRIIPISDPQSWNYYLDQVGCYDIYHTNLYHSLNTEGEARLLVFEERDSLMLLPVIFREIPGTGWKDVSSVYGYAGWLCRKPDFTPLLFDLLEEYFRQESVVSVFLRLHPLIENADCFLRGEVKPLNITTGIDMSLSPSDQVMGYSKSVRRSIAKSRKLGMQVRMAEMMADVNAFVDIYYQAMKRIGAAPQYFFPGSYFERLWKSESFQTYILLAEMKGEITAAGLFTVCCGIMQYHLGGVATAYQELSPLKLLIDSARELAVKDKCAYFHLGGGYGGKDDNLFLFKSRMTTLRYQFKVLQWVINPEIYDLLSSGGKKTSFFPLYRSFK